MRTKLKSMDISKVKSVKSNTIYVIVSAGYPTMAFWQKSEAERVMVLTLQNMPKSAIVKPRLHECQLY